MEFKKDIALLYHNALSTAQRNNPTSVIPHKELTEEQIAAMPVQLKSKYKPFATYWEFLCPTNNITYNVYIPGMDPFDKFDFTKAIPNPATRKEAATKPEYKKYYELKTYNK